MFLIVLFIWLIVRDNVEPITHKTKCLKKTIQMPAVPKAPPGEHLREPSSQLIDRQTTLGVVHLQAKLHQTKWGHITLPSRVYNSSATTSTTTAATSTWGLYQTEWGHITPLRGCTPSTPSQPIWGQQQHKSETRLERPT